ncbi:MAG: ribonuclease T2 [Paracoccaceae bacterium]
MRWLFALILATAPAFAEGEKAGAFDYYVMALSWSASWCAAEGDARGADQCDPRHDHTFVLHGLWPQNELGWPSWCRTVERDATRGETAGMADVMGSAGSAWHQWKKHGRCSGLAAADYFALARKALARVAIPAVFAQVDRTLRVDPAVIEAAFVEANPGLSAPMITVTCKDGRIAEARICLTRDLAFRACGPDAARDCRMTGAELPPVR